MMEHSRQSRCCASTMASSSTRHTPVPVARARPTAYVPARFAPSESAAMPDTSMSTGSPAARAEWRALQPRDSTPTTLTRPPNHAMNPEMRPPPPTATSTVSRPGHWSSHSAATVPWPRTVPRPSYAWAPMAPEAAWKASHACRASAYRSPPTRRSAPHARIFACFAGDEISGTNIVAGWPRRRAAWLTAMPWLPPLAAATPEAGTSVVSSVSKAPRTLKDPVCCMHSSLRLIEAGVVVDGRVTSTSNTGVRRT
mmetsp:Transcript_26498/g.88769  ORF Transcript_26498/g.88769 Transcript_26498/m.88769 type:complete len:254 (-) Transcript_26498:101-862(-)